MINKDTLYRYFEEHYFSKRDMLPRIPLGLDPDAFWKDILTRRKARATPLPITGPRGLPYWYVTTEKMISASEMIVEELMETDPYVQSPGPLSSLEEVFYTSYVEGSPMTMPEAMEFLQSDMAPGDVREQMIVNNRSALSFAGSNLYQPISEEYIKELAMILTQNMVGGGKEYRTSDWVNIPSMMGEAYELPMAISIPDKVKEITGFLSDPSVHPLIKSAVVQAWVLAVRPFPEGNERLARLLSMVILVRAGYSFFREVSLSGLIARNGYPYYNAAANILRSENGGDLTYFIEYYLTLLKEAVQELRQKRSIEVEERIEAEVELGRTVIRSAPETKRVVDAITTQAPVEDDPTWPPGPGSGSVDTVGDSLAADGFEVVDAEPESSVQVDLWNHNVSWAGEAKVRSELEEIAERKSLNLESQLAKTLLKCLDRGMYIFSSKDLKEKMGYIGSNFWRIPGKIQERGILETIGIVRTMKIYMFSAGELSEKDYTTGFIEALNALEESNSTKDRRIGTAIRSCLRRGIITVQDYTDDGKWNEEMKLAEQMGFVRRITEDRCLIMQDVKPCFDLLDSGQKRRARRLFDSFGEDAFSLEMVVATMDYSSSTASAYLHQFTLLRILECRKKMYQFLVNPKEHPEVFEDVA